MFRSSIRYSFRVIAPAIGFLTLLVAIGADFGGFRSLAFSFDDDAGRADASNGKIFYQRGPRATSDIYSITAGSGTSTGLVRGYHPAVSPDGSTVAFVNNNNLAGAANGEILLMKIDGTSVRRLPTPRVGFSPTWAPDGARLAFVRGDFDSVGDDGKGQLCVINMTLNSEGANETLIPTTQQISRPSWGFTNRIAAACYTPRPGGGVDSLGVCVTSTIPQTSQIVTNPPTISLISGSNTNDRDATWSPDGNSIAFTSTRDFPTPTANEIYKSNPDGTSQVKLTNTLVSFKSGLSWSPDGTRIAFSRNGTQGPNNADLRTVTTDGTSQFASTTTFGSGDVFPNWGVLPGSAATPTPTPFPRELSIQNSQGAAGETVTVPVNLYAVGDEASLSFSISFDAARFSGATVRLGPQILAGAELSVNQTQAASGKLGVLVDSPVRLSNAGQNRILEVLLVARSNAAVGASAVTFGDVPTVRSTSSASGSTLLTGYNAGTVILTASTSTPTNGKIAFEFFSNGAGVVQVYTVNDAAGATAAVLCGGAAESRHPAYSADGTKLAFMRSGTIWTANADCTNPVSTGSSGDNPTWSPDGTRIAFTRGSTFTDVWVMNIDGTSQAKLTDITTETKPSGSFSNTQPSWGSNNKIVFKGTFRKIVNGSQASVGDIWTMDAAGTTFVRLTDDPVNAYAPDWSPDATKIVFASNRATNRGEIYTMDAAGANVTRITSNASISNSNPAWSPDGTKIVHDDDFSNITTRDASGANGNARALGNFPDWAPGAAAASVDLSMESVLSQNPAVVGDNFIYTFTVRNNSQPTATGIRIVTDPLPANIRLHPIMLNCSMATDRRVTCTFTNSVLGAGALPTGFQTTFIADQTGTATVRATVSANETDPNPANNSGSFTTTIVAQGADLKTSIININPQNPSVDRELSYKVWLRNLGPQASAADTRLTIQIPSNTTIVKPSGVTDAALAIPGCSRIGTGRNYRCEVGSMPTGTERFFDVKVKPTAPGLIALSANATASTADPTEADQSVSVPLTVTDVPRPSNDNLANAQPVAGEHFTVTGSSVNGTLERANDTIDAGGELGHARMAGGKSVWYLWTAPARRGEARVSTAGSSFDTLLDVHAFTQTPLPVVGYSDDYGTVATSQLTFKYQPGTAYYIAVDGFRGASGDISLKLDVTYFEDPGNYRVTQQINGFSPAVTCSASSNLNDPLCSQGRDTNGILTLKIKGKNFTLQSEVLIDGRPPTGFTLSGSAFEGRTTFRSSTELEVTVPPSPPLLVQRIAEAGVVTEVNINTGNAARPDEIFQALAANKGLIKNLDLKNATIGPGQSAPICGPKLFNKDGGETCMEMINFGPNPVTVSPTWFAALAYCEDATSTTTAKLQCAENLTNGRPFSVNPGVAPPTGITLTQTIPLPSGPPPAGLQPQFTISGGIPLITDCSACIGLVGQDGGTLIGNDGSTLIGNDGSTLIGNDGSTLIGNDGSTLIGNDGSTLRISPAALIGNDGSTRGDQFGLDWLLRGEVQEELANSPSPRSPADLAKDTSGLVVVKGANGSGPTVTYTTDEVTGESYATISITLDNTSVPKVSNLSNVVFNVGLNPSVIKLQSGTIAVDEGAGFAAVTVVRAGGANAPATVEYTTNQTVDVASCVPSTATTGKAGERCDYGMALGTIKFAANETSKEIRIPIVDDKFAEGNESFKVILGNALGAAIELPSAVTINITDNDGVSGPNNPLDDSNAHFFVRQQYLDLLGREPSGPEMTAGTDPIVQCAADAACRKTKMVDVSQSLFTRAQPAYNYVFRLYRAAFGNTQPFPLVDASSLPAEARKWPAYTAMSRDRALLAEGTGFLQSQLDFASSFVLRRAFVEKYSVETLSDGPSFVDAVLATIRTDSGVDLVAQRNLLIAQYDQAGGSMAGRAAVMFRLADASLTNPVANTAFISAEEARSFTSLLYVGYLKRDGTVAALNTLVPQVQAATDRRAFIDQFVNGAEYRLRFAPAPADAVYTVSGRVLTPSGQGLRNATVVITTPQGVRRTAITSSFGLFSFANVPAGSTHTLSVVSKRYRFSPRTLQVNDNRAVGDVVGLE